MSAALLVGVVRVGFLAIYRGDELRLKAEQRQLSDSTITAERGTIYDSNMKVLAQSASAWLVYLNPSKITDDDKSTAKEKKEILATNLSEILGVDEEKVRSACEKSESGYVKIAGQVEKDAKEKVVKLRSENKLTEIIGINEDTKRYYPYNNFAASVIGFLNSDGEGAEGIEHQYNDVLTGTAGRKVTAQNARSETLSTDYETVYDAKQGTSLVLTIDETIQYYLEEALNQAVIDTKASNAYGIVMDVETGAILAMSTMPDYNLNEPRKISNQLLAEQIEAATAKGDNSAYTNGLFSQWRNRVISDTYEPGSVFKTFVLSAGLEEGVVNANTTYTCVGGIQVANNYIKCWKRGGHGTETLAQGLMNSCNPFFITIGQRMGSELYFKYFEAFGFTEPTGIDLPGEATPKANITYYTLDKLGKAELSSCSFGQTFQISPIQMITGIACIANGGKLMTPYLIAKTVDSEGNTISETQPKQRRQVISEKTSKQVASIMEQVVSKGTGKNAYVAGYRVAGKTGTSEKLNSNGQYIASFSGFAPADDPKIAVLVAIDEPQGEHGGGAIAAPIVGDIFEKALVYLNVEARYTDEELAKITKTAPSLVGKTVAAAQSEVKKAGFTTKIVGSGNTVVSQTPAAKQSLPADGVIVIYTEQNEAAVTAKIPKLTGLSISGANRAAVNAGFNIKIIGATYSNSEVSSYRQSVVEGTEAEIGSVITVYFKSSVNVTDG